MTAIRGLTIKSEQANGQTYYEGEILTIEGFSQYNDNQVRFKEISDYWILPSKFQLFKDRNGNDDDARPPIGTVARFYLKTNPKKQDPSKLYFDIVSIEKVSADEKPQEQEAHQDPREAWTDTKDLPESEYRGQIEIPLNVRIAKAQAWNGLTAVLSGNNVLVFKTQEETDKAIADWHAGYEALKAGKTPFTEPDAATESVEAEECTHEQFDWIPLPSHGHREVGDATKVCLNPDCGQKFAPHGVRDEDNPTVEDVEGVPGW